MSVAHAITHSVLLRDIHSILEFGSNEGATYFALKPARYHGIDIQPKWYPEGIDGCTVEQADIYDWTPCAETFDLVICDAHGSATAPDLYEITVMQITKAKPLSRFVAVDDCWYEPIGRATSELLGPADEIIRKRRGFQIWRVS